MQVLDRKQGRQGYFLAENKRNAVNAADGGNASLRWRAFWRNFHGTKSKSSLRFHPRRAACRHRGHRRTRRACCCPLFRRPRESARRMQCQNHLRQMGLACQMHHDTYGILPTMGWWDGDFAVRNIGAVASSTPPQQFGWMYQILPFIERKDIWDLPQSDPDDSAVKQAPTKIYFCPSRRRPVVLIGTNRGALNDYVANGGGRVEGNGGWTDDTRARAGAMDASPSDGNLVPRRVRLAEITDGTTQTLLIGEKHLRVIQYRGGGKTMTKAIGPGSIAIRAAGHAAGKRIMGYRTSMTT